MIMLPSSCLGTSAKNAWAGGERFEAVLNFRVADPLVFKGSGF
jgi:hypothetical protein